MDRDREDLLALLDLVEDGDLGDFPDCESELSATRRVARELAAATRAALAARPQLEQVGWYTPGMGDGPNIGGLIDGKLDDNDEPVYRVVAVAGSATPTVLPVDMKALARDAVAEAQPRYGPGPGIDLAGRRHPPETSMARARRLVAGWLRLLADRLDHAGAPKCLGYSFTFEDHVGIRFRDDGRGCPVWRYGDEDYDRAWTEADRQ